MSKLSSAIHAIPGLNATDQAILLGLEKFADKDGRCWPKVGTVKEESKFSRSTIFAAYKRLEERGLMRRRARFREDRSQTSNMYWINMELIYSLAAEAKGLRKPSTSRKITQIVHKDVPIPDPISAAQPVDKPAHPPSSSWTPRTSSVELKTKTLGFSSEVDLRPREDDQKHGPLARIEKPKPRPPQPLTDDPTASPHERAARVVAALPSINGAPITGSLWDDLVRAAAVHITNGWCPRKLLQNVTSTDMTGMNGPHGYKRRLANVGKPQGADFGRHPFAAAPNGKCMCGIQKVSGLHGYKAADHIADEEIHRPTDTKPVVSPRPNLLAALLEAAANMPKIN